MKVHWASAAAIILVSQTATAVWNYDTAYSCLKSLSSAPVSSTPVVFNRTGLGIFPAGKTTGAGFVIITPKTAYFFPQDEMSKSGDTQLKISVQVPDGEPNVIKVYFNPAGATPKDRLTLGSTNEFDRQFAALSAMDEWGQDAINKFIGQTLLLTRPLFTNNRPALIAAIEPCKKVDWDFPINMGNGTESKFYIEFHAIREKLKPSFFSMEYWFPKKGTN